MSIVGINLSDRVRMTASEPQPTTLLDHIDARQNEVLKQLDELNARVQNALQQWTANQSPSTETTDEP